MRSLLVGILLVFVCMRGWAQTSTCAQTLRLAVSTYELGRLSEVPGILKDCLSKEGGANAFTKQERVTALRILTLAYIYQEEPEKADETMLLLLNTDHFFEINENVDPAEFTALYKTFRTKPIYSVGGKFGGNGSFPTPTKNFFIGSDAASNGEYSTGYNIQIGGVFEKALFEKKSGSRWTAAPEIMFLQNKFSYANEQLTTNDATGESNALLEADFSQTRIDLNLLVQYKLKDHYLNPYVSLGPAISYLLSASGQFQTQFPTIGTAVTGPSIDLKDSFESLDYALVASAGLKFKFGEVYLTADIRYKYGFANQIDEEARTNPEAAFDFGTISNDFRQSNIMINLGFVYPYFNPKKLLR